ncbi:MAG: DUF6489 family protein [Rhodospirillales bacterium]|nr:DUF6489 family protein [Rhodospirillales bacterium]MDP7651587.1 DUF6489 family protein [Rhodospirillales bacterium]HJO97351.1 DUF6489 family protein [Rhodospirillales bacterium]|tara:strand:- start:217 stop:456 length:240 start_codon:yes stop_codon:yes gene_type:complete
MKVRIDIDCSPDEARTFFGLPAVEPMQKAMMAEVEERLKASLETMTPEDLIKTWMPAGVEGFEKMQKMFWSSMTDKKTE